MSVSVRPSVLSPVPCLARQGRKRLSMSAAGFYGLDVYSLLESLESIIDYLKEKVGPCLFCLRQHIDRQCRVSVFTVYSDCN